jgi:hypothetical protein
VLIICCGRLDRHWTAPQGGKEFTLPLTLDLRISVILILQALSQQPSDSPPDDRIRQHPFFHESNQQVHGFTSNR